MDSLYKRYASALLSLAMDDSDVEGYRSDVKELRKAFKENQEIIHLLSSAFLEFEEKEAVIDRIYQGKENIKNFIILVQFSHIHIKFYYKL